MQHTTIILIAGLIASTCLASAAGKLTNPNIQGWLSDSVPTPDSSSDYSPNSRLTLPEGQQFAIVHAQFGLDWTDADDEKEQIEHSYADIRLDLADGTQIAPTAAISPDGRIDTYSSAEREDIEAREDWGAEELRWGAIFILPDSDLNEAKLTFLDQSYPIKFANTQPPHASESIRVKVDSVSRLKSLTSEPGAERRFPGASIQLDFEGKGLLQVDLVINALKPNIIGGENRMIFRPSDFSLKTAHGSIEPFGILGSRGQIIRSTIYNVSRKSLDELPEAKQEISLLFRASDDFQDGQLEYFGKAIAEVTIATE